MGSLFKRTERRPVPRGAEVVVKDGKRFARLKLRGKTVTAEIHTAPDGTETVGVKSPTYFAKFTDHTGRTVVRSTGCRDESTARQKLAGWEREVEQIRAGVLDATALDTARAAAGSIEPHLDAYEQSLIARDVSDMYRANAVRAIRRLMAEVPLASLRDLRREIVEPWFANAISGGMKARTRNYYRESILLFANWCRETGRVREHDLDKLPNADRRSNPVRPRRALTEDEFARLLAVARTRPLDDARTVRRGERKGQRVANLSSDAVKELDELGRERVLIYRTLILTGLRLTELRTLTVARLDLTPGAEVIRLESRNEKNGAGSTLPVRADLADELRQWIAEKNLTPADRLFTVPARLRLILDRDMKAAKIPKRDERGRTVDVHALRTTFATHLSTTGTTPRTAQAAMRHSDIKLTMGVYTDPALLDVRHALDRLPAFGLTENRDQKRDQLRDLEGQNVATSGKMEQSSDGSEVREQSAVNPCPGNEKTPVTTGVITGAVVPSSRADRIRTCDLLVPNQEPTPATAGNPSVSAPSTETVSKIVTSTPAPALPLAELLRQLAALSPAERQAIAALLAPSPVATDNRPSPPPAVPDDRCPLDTRGKG